MIQQIFQYIILSVSFIPCNFKFYIFFLKSLLILPIFIPFRRNLYGAYLIFISVHITLTPQYFIVQNISMPPKKKTPSKTPPHKQNSSSKTSNQKKQQKKQEIFDDHSEQKTGKNTSQLTPLPRKADESSSQSHIIRPRRSNRKKRDDIQYFPNKVQKLKKQKKQHKIQKKQQEKKKTKNKSKQSQKQIFKVKKTKATKQKSDTDKNNDDKQQNQQKDEDKNLQEIELKEEINGQVMIQNGNMKNEVKQQIQNINSIDILITQNAQEQHQQSHEFQTNQNLENQPMIDLQLNDNKNQNGIKQIKVENEIIQQNKKDDNQSQKSSTQNDKNQDVHKKKHKKHFKKPIKHINEPLPPPTNATMKKPQPVQDISQSQLDEQYVKQTLIRQNDLLKNISLRCTQFFKDLSQFCYTFYKSMDKPQNNINKSLINFDMKKYRSKLLNKNELLSSSPYLNKKTNFQFRRKDYNDPNMPRRPMAAYILYFQQQKSGFMKEYPGRNLAQITKLIGKNWGQLTAQEKKKYLDTAAQDRKRYQNQMLTYRQNKAIEAGHDPSLVKLAKPRKKKPRMGIQQLLMKEKLAVQQKQQKQQNINEQNVNQHETSQVDQIDIHLSHQQEIDPQFGEIPQQLQKQQFDKSA